MNFLKPLLQSSVSRKRRFNRTKNNYFCIETLEPRIAFNATAMERPPLDSDDHNETVELCDFIQGPLLTPFVRAWGPIQSSQPRPQINQRPQQIRWSGWPHDNIDRREQAFTITSITDGVTIEKWDYESNQWRDVSVSPSTSNPRELLNVLKQRTIQPDDMYRITDYRSPIIGGGVCSLWVAATDSLYPSFKAVWADGSDVDYSSLPQQDWADDCGGLPGQPPWGYGEVIENDVPTAGNDLNPINIVDERLTNTDRAFVDLSLTNLVNADEGDEDEVEPDLVAQTLGTNKLTNTDLAFKDPALITLVNAYPTDLDLSDSTETKKISFASILPAAFESADTVIQPIN